MTIKSTIYSSVILTMLISTLFYTSMSFVSANEESDPNISISAIKTDNTETAKPGDILIYTIVLTNNSSEDASVNVTDHLPNELIPIATSPQAQANSEERTITWEQITVPASDEITLGLQARIADAVPNNNIVENRADISGPNIELTATDRTRIETTDINNAPPVASINPTAPTGTSSIIAIMSIVAIIGGAIGSRKMFTNIN